MSQSKTELTSLTLSEAAEGLRAKHFSSRELTLACVHRIEQLNPKLNAFITVTAESALQEAEHADRDIQRGEHRGELHGIPIALKDLVDTAGVRTTAASAVFKDRVPERDATVVRRLREAGAIFLGKLNLHEFAYGGSGVISHFGPVRNPWDTTKTTGGSSSGSAAAVASGMCYAAIGTDTAGSIRLPASFCGITGLKPSYGLVSASGVIPLSWTYDHIGPMTRNARDAAIMLDAIAGFDVEDPTSLQASYESSAKAIDALPQGLRLGVARKFFCEELDSAVADAFEKALGVLAKLLKTLIIEVELPLEQTNVVRIAEPYAFHEELLEKNANLYQTATLQRIRSGEGVSATKYLNARRELEKLRRASVSIFDKVDVIATPTVPCLPYEIDDLINNPDQLRPKELRMLRNTRPFNTLGWPTITVPCGISGHLPIGIQLAVVPGRDGLVLQLAHLFEQTTKWATRLPITS
jgi:aspartyl-tRNA(Asn)/glutamyl-tRNA(Gln) amidotransferase subunit A